MAKRKTKSAFQSKLAKAAKRHANDETDYGQDFTNLPPGITGGIAQISAARFGEFKSGANEGEPFIYLAGVVKKPSQHIYSPKVFADGAVQVLEAQTMDILGLQTGMTLPLCDTQTATGKVTNFDANFEIAMNELRKLGVDTSEIQTQEDIQELLDLLLEEKPHFRFSTSAGKPTAAYPEARTWENWRGDRGLEEYEEEDSDDEVEEEEDEEEEETNDEEEEEEEEEEDDEENDVEEDDEDEDDEEEEEDEEEDEEEEEFIPVKGDIYLYKPPRKKKWIDVEATRILKTKKTCNLKSYDDGKIFKDVPWDKLKESE
jgi:hypothetical protein